MQPTARSTTATARPSSWPSTGTAIAEHAFLSDCRTSALVTRQGSVDWLCLPRFDSPPVLGRLLDAGAGHLLVRPSDPDAVAVRRYLPATLVLETTWTCADGTLQVVDALALGADERGHELGRSSPGVLLRRARCTAGAVELVVEWAPRPEFGLVHPRLEPVPGGLRSYGGSTVVQLSTGASFDVDGATATARVRLDEGQDLTLAVQQGSAWDVPPEVWQPDDVHRRLEATREAWQSWSDQHQRYRGPLSELVHRSGLVLQGLTYAPSGAMVAAATTSLPEGEGSGRTWDYRFTWVRDASMTLRGLWVAACPDEAARSFAFLARAAGTQLDRGRHLQIMFGVGGERDLTERELPHLAGWRGSRPVRAGNGAWDQHQQDVYGALLDAAWVLRAQLEPLEPATADLLVAAVDAAARDWQVVDQGIWEVRGPAKPYLHSVLMCWVALDRGIRLAPVLGAEDAVERWTAARADVRAAVLERGWDPAVGAFTQALDSPELDASSLLVALVGILPPDDPRLGATIDAVTAGLSDERGMLYRYRGDDGLEGDEGSFLLCTFWLAEALAVTGRTEQAEQVLRRAAGHANDLGLLAEQTSPSGELLGNFPQAFSHLGLVLAAQALADATGAAAPQPGAAALGTAGPAT
jgi:GH15 family glucan-1,4-alpha-glucosidase